MVQVCGLKWSPNGRQLASGGNDNMLCVWDETVSQARLLLECVQRAVPCDGVLRAGFVRGMLCSARTGTMSQLSRRSHGARSSRTRSQVAAARPTGGLRYGIRFRACARWRRTQTRRY